MPTTITIEVVGDKRIQERLKRLGSGMYQLDNAFRQIGQYLATYFGNEGFASQGSVFGLSWNRLNPTYSIWKSKHFPGRGPLVRTGKMQDSFTFHSGSQGVAITNTAPYFKYHQSQSARSKLPRRSMMGVNDRNKAMVAKLIREEIRLKLVG